VNNHKLPKKRKSDKVQKMTPPIKKYPKIDRLYEKNIDNYEQMVCLISSFIALSHM
jgi:hypothetical protein